MTKTLKQDIALFIAIFAAAAISATLVAGAQTGPASTRLGEAGDVRFGAAPTQEPVLAPAQAPIVQPHAFPEMLPDPDLPTNNRELLGLMLATGINPVLSALVLGLFVVGYTHHRKVVNRRMKASTK